MRTRAAALAVLMLGVAAPASSASAFQFGPERGAYEARYREPPAAIDLYGANRAPGYASCPMSSAAEGNANQQTRPVMQYGQTSGGNRC